YVTSFRRAEAGRPQCCSAQDHEKAVEITKEQARPDANFGGAGQCPAELSTEPAKLRRLIKRDVVRVEEHPPAAVDDFTAMEIFSWRLRAELFAGRLVFLKPLFLKVLFLPRLVTVVASQFLEASQREDDVTALAGTTGGPKPLPERPKPVESQVRGQRGLPERSKRPDGQLEGRKASQCSKRPGGQLGGRKTSQSSLPAEQRAVRAGRHEAVKDAANAPDR